MENKITQLELQERQGWTLNQKVDHSLGVIDHFKSIYPNAKVSFSGGVDSTVMFYLCRIIDPNMVGVFANTTNEFSEIVKFVKTFDNIKIVHPDKSFPQIIEKCGFPLVSKKIARMVNDVKHPTLRNQKSVQLYSTGIKSDGTRGKYFIPEKWKHLIDAPFDLTYKCCNELKKKPLQGYLKDGVFIGTMASDSGLREDSYKKTGCINFGENKCMPLSIWNTTDVWEFIKKQNIKYCNVYDSGEKHTGCAYCGFGCQFDKTRFDRLKVREPKRYEQIMNLKNNGITYREAINFTLKRNI